MPVYYQSLSPELTAWLMEQSVFFIASAPLLGKHINLSPKGLPASSFAVLGPNRVAYIDAPGSGNETISHVYENGRATVMFASFARSPRILRLFCRGRVVEKEEEEFGKLLEEMGMQVGEGKGLEAARAVVVMDVWKVQTSCGFGVPIASTTASPDGEVKAVFTERDTLANWGRKMVSQGKMDDYEVEWNSDSLDGLPGLRSARRHGGERWLWVGDAKARVKRVFGEWDALLVGVAVGAVVGAVGMRAAAAAAAGR
ncbi:hypothetical protein P167DRAFT_548362 [Morchella conica CCBAS932]|uniref:Pyridoxamine 5'-phosphate oxidase N-terminal domain-containing protein n=1 Tax=Morchella conica CCBAS932 TaxID=1392247 RepID=A0A3N4KLB4_9PEZI|nr:hypothetical protein P167DRAFT_548362 [Morchella conica CCBAS932]